MKPRIKVFFTDFWVGFHPTENIFVQLLRKNFEVVVDRNPDILFYSVYNFNHLKYRCSKILFTAENVRPNFNECDFALSFDYSSFKGRNFRLPYYGTRYLNRLPDLCKPKNPEQVLRKKKKFCCMLVSNGRAKERNRFFDMLSVYKKVDSGGRYMNNVGGPVEDKLEFIKDYKFVLSFENSSYPGYTTEKIVEPMLVGSIPVYWGSPVIERDFNTNSFINLHDFDSFENAMKRIIEMDNDDELYMSYQREPWFPDNRFPEALQFDAIATKLKEIVDKCINGKPVSSRWYYPVTSEMNRRKRKLFSRIYGRPHFYF